MKQLTFVPYGDTLDGSAEREQHSSFLAGYLRERLAPALDAWEGEMPEHVRKVGGSSARKQWGDLKMKSTAQGVCCLCCGPLLGCVQDCVPVQAMQACSAVQPQVLSTLKQNAEVSRPLQVHSMLSAVEDAAPEGAELEAFLGKPCNHMARLIRDLCAPDAVQENLKNVLTFIKNVSASFAL